MGILRIETFVFTDKTKKPEILADIFQIEKYDLVSNSFTCGRQDPPLPMAQMKSISKTVDKKELK